MTLKARQRGAFEGPKGVQLEVFREPQEGCSWTLSMGLKYPGLRNSSFQVYYGLLLYYYRYVNMSCNYRSADLYYKATFYEL